jgi:hypothetical protein
MGDVGFFPPDDMKKVCFIASHLMSGSSTLFEMLDHNPRVQGFRSSRPYYDMPTIMALTKHPHKLNTQAAIFVDELLYNYWLQTKDAYRYCKFIYVVRPPEGVLGELVAQKLYKPQQACDYYCYRLRRMCEMAKRTPGAVLLTYEDIVTGRGLPLIEEYLGLKQRIDLMPVRSAPTRPISYDLLQRAERAHSHYLSYLFSQNLVWTGNPVGDKVC